jgi:hypothetical protein
VRCKIDGGHFKTDQEKEGGLPMKLRRLIPVVLAVMLLFGAVAPAAMADVDVAICKIMRVGYRPDLGVAVQLDDQASPGLWTGARQFYLSPSLGNQGYAALLTAYSMGKTVWVRIAGTGAASSLITIIYIND